jgi:ubiquinone/menaquinone biosynthesis C-methylase UbiE
MEPSEVAAHWESNADTWTRLVRAGYDVYRDWHNTPAFLAVLPTVNRLKGLDIGCGEGANTRALAQLGAHMTGVDIAPTFIRYAQAEEERAPLSIHYRVGDGMALPFESESFDFATAFMSLMDMPDQGKALWEAARVLRPGGFLQFSILHPCFATPYRKVLRDSDGKVRAIEVGRYFDRTDGEVERWIFGAVPAAKRQQYQPFTVPRFHRTLGAWVQMICDAGLQIEAMYEPTATDAEVRKTQALDDTQVVPLFLQIRTRKHSVKEERPA